MTKPTFGKTNIEATVQAAQRGDAGAFASLYDSHAGKIYALCRRLSAEEPLAAALVQRVFLRAARRLRSFRGERSFANWLHRVALSTILEGDPGRTAENVSVRIAEDFAWMEDDLGGPARLANPTTAIDLEAAIASLPAGARAVFVLHDIEGYAHTEIGVLLQITEGSSKAHLLGARRRLWQRLPA